MSRLIAISASGATSFEAGTLADAATAPAPVRHDGVVATIPVSGFLSSGHHQLLRLISAALAADPDVCATVLEMDSPGGDVAGLADAAAALGRLREAKPLVVYSPGNLASAAYRLAVEADAIVLNEDAETGSVGAMAVVTNTTEADKRAGIDRKFIVAKISPKKRTDPHSPENIKRLEARVDGMGQRFVEAVAQRRGVTVEHVLAHFGEGAVLDPPTALAVGAIDAIGSLTDAQALAMRLAAERMTTEAQGAATDNFYACADPGAEHDHRAPVAHHSQEGKMPITRLVATGLDKGVVAVKEGDLRELESSREAFMTKTSALEQKISAAVVEREALVAARDAFKAQAEATASELTALKAKAEEDKAAAAEAARVEKRDALIASAITDGRVGPGDTNLKTKLVALGDALGNEQLGEFIEAMPRMHAAGEAPQGHGGSSEPAADLSTKNGVVAHVQHLAATQHNGNFSAAWEAFARNPNNSEAVSLWQEG